jgi:hypothetical protein
VRALLPLVEQNRGAEQRTEMAQPPSSHPQVAYRPRMAARPSNNLQRTPAAPFVFRAWISICPERWPASRSEPRRWSRNSRLLVTSQNTPGNRTARRHDRSRTRRRSRHHRDCATTARASAARGARSRHPHAASLNLSDGCRRATLDFSRGCLRSRYDRIMTSQLTAFLARRWCVPESSLGVEVQPLDGGLESVVARARITPPQVASGVPRDVVVKQLSGALAREGDVSDALWRHLERPPAVQMFGRDVYG